MARQKKPVHRVQMTEIKRNIIHQLLFAPFQLQQFFQHHISLYVEVLLPLSDYVCKF